MKKAILPFVFMFSLIGMSLSSCDEVVGILEDLLTEGDATDGLKEALRVAADTSVTQGSALDGYFGNTLIKILLPPEADVIVAAVGSVPGIGQPLIDEVVLKLNRAAEDAAPQATEILLNAITNITIADAIAIVNGQNDAATQFLRTNTQDNINVLFKPHIEASLTAVGAQQAWNQLTNTYNSVPLLADVNTDLAEYTTERASSGLFELIAIEEGKIREDPLHRVSEILESVFGNN